MDMTSIRRIQLIATIKPNVNNWIISILYSKHTFYDWNTLCYGISVHKEPLYKEHKISGVSWSGWGKEGQRVSGRRAVVTNPLCVREGVTLVDTLSRNTVLHIINTPCHYRHNEYQINTEYTSLVYPLIPDCLS